MKRILHLAACYLSVIFAASAAEYKAAPDWLSAGRRMVRVPVPTEKLRDGGRIEAPAPVQFCGRTPEGQGGPFCVMSGTEKLWEGPAGQEFCVKAPPCVKNLYLMSMGGRNLGWSKLKWVCEDAVKPWAKGFHFVDGIKVYEAEKAGVTPGEEDAGPALRRLLSLVRQESLAMGRKGKRQRKSRIVLPKGTYHFYPEGALKMSLYVSNHDQQDISPVGVPLVDLQWVELDCSGSQFVFHGKMQPFLIMNSSSVQVKDVAISYSAPYYTEGEITEIADGKTTLRFAPMFRWKVANGRYRILRDDGEDGVNAALPFEKDGAMVPRQGGGDIGWTDRAEQLSENTVRFDADAGRLGLRVGQVMTLRHGGRPHPAMVLYNARDTQLENVIFHDSQGMALLAQRSSGITIRGGGCITAKGRVYTVSADATHFSNCRGEILTENALYEGMMDDAINVHSTSLSIEQVESPTCFIAKYMHGQSVGFEVFRPGEQVQFIKGQTLENHPKLGKAKKVEKLDETHLRITLEKPLPEGIGQGDAVENADWYPSVTFRDNTVRYNRARGCLFTTPKKVLVEGCKFIRSHGTAILLAGDAQGWYESGRCLDVTIRRNLFDHNLTASYQFCEAIISIYPEVRRLNQQQEPYHRHITIEDNTFRTHRVPLLFVRSADDIIWRNNKVIYDEQYPARRNGEPFIFAGPKPKNSQIPEKP